MRKETDMSDEILIKQCSPTLAGLKTAGLFTMKYQSRDRLMKDVCDYNHRLNRKGLRLLPLKLEEDAGGASGSALLYLYRPDRLERDLVQMESADILRRFGYTDGSQGRCIQRLIGRLNSGKDFPHEIGLFLGYPPEDVRGFIENRAGGYKLVGTWKVYGDAENAEKLFKKYRMCTKLYSEQWAKGKSIEELSVRI